MPIRRRDLEVVCSSLALHSVWVCVGVKEHEYESKYLCSLTCMLTVGEQTSLGERPQVYPLFGK